MISMPSSVYNQTHLAKQKEIKGVPTVLYVSPNGTVNEVEDIRDEAKMSSLLKSNSTSELTTSETPVETVIPTEMPIVEPKATALKIPGLTESALPTTPVSQVQINRSKNVVPNKPTNTLKPILPGVTSQSNPLTPLPGVPVSSEEVKQAGGAYIQKGGSPWTAFMMAARQAAPAALLLGAYSTLPQRSSGLGRPRSRSNKSRRHRMPPK
jgi:hypothetical protein